ncbi:MAG: rRNA maturation RNase YbeY [Rhodospirillaceae bacterium]|nr:rRNA maturation RNase YbeY [Rhodospirillaceae bacterium]
MINTDFLIMPLDPVEMTSAEQDPEPDSPDAVDHAYHSWVTADNHHFDHNLSDPRWISCVFSSEVKCITLIDLAVRYLPAKFSGPIEVSVLWTDDLTIAELNQHFRTKSGATNILSFPSDDQSVLTEDRLFMGDLVLGFETVMSEAKAAGISEQDHIAHLVLHGLLHLAGFDHILEDEAADMEKIESYLLSEIGIADPYQDVTYTPAEARDAPL